MLMKLSVGWAFQSVRPVWCWANPEVPKGTSLRYRTRINLLSKICWSCIRSIQGMVIAGSRSSYVSGIGLSTSSEFTGFGAKKGLKYLASSIRNVEVMVAVTTPAIVNGRNIIIIYGVMTS